MPHDEAGRLTALRSFDLLHSHKEESLNNLAQLMAEDFEVPVAAITFVDREQVFVKASVGLNGVESARRNESFCALAILSDEVTVIDHGMNNPCILQAREGAHELDLAFYAGAPLVTRDGFHIGAVSVADHKSRRFSPKDEGRLQRYARTVMFEIETRTELKRSREEIREKELHLKEAYQLARIGSWEFDVVNCVGTWSDELFEIYGVEKNSVTTDIATLYRSLVHPDDMEVVMESFAHPEKIPRSIIRKFIKPNGEILYLNQLCEHEYDPEGRLLKLKGISQDVTERMQFEEKLQLSEKRFSSLVRNSSDLIGIIDSQGNYLFVAESSLRVLGYDPAFFHGRNAFEFIHPEDQEKVAACLSLIQTNKYIEVPVFRFLGAGGEWRYLETKVANLLDDPIIAGLVVNSRDITEHVMAEEALKAREQKFRALVHNSSDILVMIDAEANFIYTSHNIKNLLGYDPEDLAGTNAFSLVHPEDLEGLQQEFEKVLRSDDTAVGVVHRFRSKSGHWVWMESKGINHLSDPQIRGIIINAREVGERIRLQQKLDEELEKRQMMITKAAITAQEKERSQVGLELHDNVNQVLTTVKLYQELCLSGIGNQEELLNKSMVLLQDSINEIRSLSKRLSAPTLGKIKLQDSVSELLDAVAATGKIVIAFDAAGFQEQEVDPELHLALYRILQEHLTNVLKYAAAGRADVVLRTEGDKLLLQVTDDGCGFDTGKKSKGIGMTNMRTRAESVKGNISFISAPGEGCTLLVLLPLDR